MPAIEITDSQFERLQRFAIPLVDTSITAFDKVLGLAEQTPSPPNKALEDPEILRFTRRTLPSMKDAVILSGTIDGEVLSRHQWVDALLVTLRVVKTKMPLVEATRGTSVNVTEQRKNTGGYRWREGLGVSVQGVSATSAARAVLDLGERYDIPVELRIRWHNSPSAAYPGQQALLLTTSD